MALLTNQEIFDKVAVHLLTQNKQSRTGDVGCAYRGNDGLSCAIGCLIPDAEYTQDIEGWLLPARLKTLSLDIDPEEREKGSEKLADILRSVGVPDTAFELLSQLQNIHDAYQPASWKERLAKCAQDNCVDSRIIQNF